MRSTISPKGFFRAAAAVLFWLLVWQAAALLVGFELLLPAPLTVFARLGELAVTTQFWQTALLSLGRVALGLVWGIVLGVVLAALSCTFRWADTLVSPAVGVVRATPVASFILLVLLWTQRGQVPVIIAALMVLPIVYGNVTRGIRETDPKLLELARAYRFSRWKTVRLVILPGVRPYFFSAVTTALGLAWKSGVAAEALCWPKVAIGTEIYYTKLNFETADLFAWTLVVILLSLGLERLVSLAVRTAERRGQHD
ncbi:MAG: ABC transporter permease subunit [Oscillospiraceae bacterium]|nr:ABC transporter permease subunit [Oscillospiraceae bacterium]